MRALAIGAAAALFLGLASAAGATPVTTDGYDTEETKQDVNLSCKEVSIASDGTVSGTCNYASGGSVATKTTSIDLDSYLGCDGGQLSWSGTDFSATATDIEIEKDGAGDRYIVLATCPNGDGGASDKELGDKVKNSSGDFAAK